MPTTRIRLLSIPELDDDHLALGHIIAELESYGENDARPAEVADVMTRLAAAAGRHFAREESLMSDDEYPLLARHRESHRELIHYIERLAQELSSGRVAVNAGLVAALWEWEIGHIETADREYADYVEKRMRG